MAAYDLVRNKTDQELLAQAGSQLDPQTFQYTANPIWIAGRMTPDKKGGMVFDDTTATEGGAQIRFYTLAEIKQAPRQNYLFIHEWQGYAALPDSGTNKFVMPFQVARAYGVL